MEVPFYCLNIDTDITHVDHLSVIFWYVETIIDSVCKPTDLNICESFVGFYFACNQKASGLKAIWYTKALRFRYTGELKSLAEVSLKLKSINERAEAD